MPEHNTITVSGKISHIFGHRFVVETGKKAILADITPHGIDQIKLHVGDDVELSGEQKPTELKVSRFTRGDKTITIEHKKKPHDDHAHAEPKHALKAARDAGFEPVGEPRRKPKHFEVLGRRNKELTELHIELDGNIRKMKPVEANDSKWSEELQEA